MNRILHMIETGGPGGAESIMVSLARNMSGADYQSNVCLLKEGWLSNHLRESSVETVIKPRQRMLDIAWLRSMKRYLVENNVCLLHAHEFSMNLYGALLSFYCKIPCVTTVHGKNYYADAWHRRAAYRFVSRQTSLIAVSNDIKHFLNENVGISPAKINVIANGIDIDRYKPSEVSRQNTRKMLGLEDRQILIGAVGNLYPVKGHTYLLDAAATVCREHPDSVFIVAGRGKLEAELKEKADNLGLSKNFQFLGFREDVAELLQAMDVFVMSSLSEGLPVSILEAMSSGTPVVSTDVGGVSEVVKHNETGLLVPAKSPKKLAQAILEYINQPAERERITKHAYSNIEKKYSLSAMLDGYRLLYKELVDNRFKMNGI